MHPNLQAWRGAQYQPPARKLSQITATAPVLVPPASAPFIESPLLGATVKGLGAVSSGMLSYSMRGMGGRWSMGLAAASAILGLLSVADFYRVGKQ